MMDTLAERFWKKVNKHGPIARKGLRRCWVWTAATDDHGYGFIAIKRSVPERVHRVSWFLEHGEWPAKGINVCHRCDNPACVRPSHLFLGTQQDNLIDMACKGRSGYKKLTAEDVREIRKLSGVIGQRPLAARFGVSRAMIRSIQQDKSWRWLDASG